MFAMTNQFHNQLYQSLVEALRSEIEEYGGLLNLLEEQQTSILKHDSVNVLEYKQKIDEQIAINQDLRNKRELIIESLGKNLGVAVNGSILKLLPLFPEQIRGLVEALVLEVIALIDKTQRKAGQSHLLLSRAYEVTEEVIRAFQPHKVMKTYDRKGSLSLKTGSDGSHVSASV